MDDLLLLRRLFHLKRVKRRVLQLQKHLGSVREEAVAKRCRLRCRGLLLVFGNRERRPTSLLGGEEHLLLLQCPCPSELPPVPLWVRVTVGPVKEALVMTLRIPAERPDRGGVYDTTVFDHVV